MIVLVLPTAVRLDHTDAAIKGCFRIRAQELANRLRLGSEEF